MEQGGPLLSHRLIGVDIDDRLGEVDEHPQSVFIGALGENDGD